MTTLAIRADLDLCSAAWIKRTPWLNRGQPIFEASSGSLCVIAGSNGCGKTLLVTALARSTESYIQRFGHRVPADVAFLPQEVCGGQHIPVRSLVRLVNRRRPRATVLTHLTRFATAFPNRNIDSLSGGERQLLLFLCVVSLDRPVYVFDEPFRHIDQTVQAFVAAEIEALVTEQRLVVLVDHDDDSDRVRCRKQIVLLPSCENSVPIQVLESTL